MTNEQKEIINALKLIRNICNNHCHCNECPFGTADKSCMIGIGTPSTWKLNDETDTWYAIIP